MASRKRKPLADSTNSHNLIPTSTLRKLVNASSKSNSVQKPHIPNFSSNSSSTNRTFCSGSENRSGTSIGSCNVSTTLNSTAVQLLTPPRVASSVGDVHHKDVAYRSRQTFKKSNKENDAGIGSSSCTPAEKRKHKVNTNVLPSDSPCSTNTKVHCNAIPKPRSAIKKAEQSNKVNLNLVGGPSEKVKESGERIINAAGPSYRRGEKRKAIPNSSGGSMGKTKEIKMVTKKMKDILESSDSSIQNQREMEKEIFSPSPILVVRTVEKGKAILHPLDTVEMTEHVQGAVNCPPPWDNNEMRKNYAGPSSCPALPRTKNTNSDYHEAGLTKSAKTWSDPHPKIRKKRCSGLKGSSEFPRDYILQQKAYFEEVDAFELVEEEVSGDELH